MAVFRVGDYLKFKFVYVTCLRAHKDLLSWDDNWQQFSGEDTTVQ